MIAQAIASVWTTVLPGTPLDFFQGGATLVSMGIIGCVIGGFAIYQYFEDWATFGALLPFSGFAMAVGMKMINPWTKENASTGKSIWKGAWLVIWFNAVGAIVCILLGFILESAGVEPAIVSEKNTSNLIFPMAFLMGGILCAIFQCCFLAFKKIAPKIASPVWILMFAWMCGAIFNIFGLSALLANQFGQGFSVMIPVGGYNMYNVGVAFADGEIMEGLVHLGSFLLAVAGLFLTGLATYVIYRVKFGCKTLAEVHLERAQRDVKELGEGVAPAAASAEAAQSSVETQGTDQTP